MIIAPVTYIPITHTVDGRSEVDKCLEGDYGLSDLLAKKLANEAFTEEDTARVTECIENRRDACNKATAWGIGIVVVALIGIIIWALIECTL